MCSPCTCSLPRTLTQIRDYDNQKNALTELEAETQKVKVVMAELDGEFGILKAERDQAQGIIKEIMTKVKAFEAELKDMEEEQKEAVAAKNEALAALDKARTDMVSGVSGQHGRFQGRQIVGGEARALGPGICTCPVWRAT